MKTLDWYSIEVAQDFYRVFRNGILIGYTTTWPDTELLLKKLRGNI